MRKENDYVWCVQVRKIDPPQFVAEIDDVLRERDGDLVGFEQCDNCGNSAYKLEWDGHLYAVCTLDPDDEVSRAFGGCGAKYRARLEKQSQVAF